MRWAILIILMVFHRSSSELSVEKKIGETFDEFHHIWHFLSPMKVVVEIKSI